MIDSAALMPRPQKRARKAAPKARAGKSEGARARIKAGAGDEVGAAELARRVAEALRGFRRDRQLSLDDLSSRSGVSRAALSQIEGGRTNPTLAVLWKVAVGLEIPFHDLLGPQPEQSVLVLRAGDALPLRSTDSRTESRLLSPGGARSDTDFVKSAAQDVRAVSGRMHPAIDHRSRARISDSQVLADQVIAITASLDPRPGLEAVGRHVIEVVLGKEVTDAIPGCKREARIQTQWLQAIDSALPIHRLDERVLIG